MDPIKHRKDLIADTLNEILRIVLATTTELEDVVSISTKIDKTNKFDDSYRKMVEIRDRLQVIADNEAGVLKRMQFLLRRN